MLEPVLQMFISLPFILVVWFSLSQYLAVLIIWRFEGKMSLIGLCILTLTSQLWCCLGEVMEPLRGGDSLEEVHHWRQALRVYNLCPTSCTHSLLPVCGSKCDQTTPAPAPMISLTVTVPSRGDGH